jgi:hypothetical protein
MGVGWPEFYAERRAPNSHMIIKTYLRAATPAPRLLAQQ